MEEIIRCDSPEFKELNKALERSFQQLDIISVKNRLIGDERYLTTEDLCEIFYISKRALQNYRDDRILPYTSIGGKILYPESRIQEVLDANYVSAIKY